MRRFQWFFGSLRCEQLGTNQSSRRRKDAENCGWSSSQPWEAVEQSRGGVEPYASLTVRTWTLSPTSSFRHVDKFLNATGGSFTVVRSSGQRRAPERRYQASRNPLGRRRDPGAPSPFSCRGSRCHCKGSDRLVSARVRFQELGCQVGFRPCQVGPRPCQVARETCRVGPRLSWVAGPVLPQNDTVEVVALATTS